MLTEIEIYENRNELLQAENWNEKIQSYSACDANGMTHVD